MKAINMLRREKSVEWKHLNATIRFGSFVKKEKFEIEGYNPITGESTSSFRSRYVACSLDLSKLPDFLLRDMAAAPTWNDLTSNGTQLDLMGKHQVAMGFSGEFSASAEVSKENS
eukprot:CAMPEP_0114506042 /NCGR_PEP_ID=MMETSP0109-20121206/11199_1 /TAXON_ID=29199 /ORGANISM="Chlorarachnion reptans, Strain CCCM449" /LENGTH=114 /DNA_ID=CAMNT_0001684569 /DNA_START=501 /DNA_END=845 /DNA_ORIENTATION=-